MQTFQILLLTSGVMLAQTAPKPQFEVASIRPHVDLPASKGKGVAGMGVRFSGPRVTVNGATLGTLIGLAYDLKLYETVSGLPNWASEQFDILAKAEGDAELTRDRSRVLFQTLLEESFKLKFHRTPKETKGYLLTVAKTDPKLKPADPATRGFMKMTSTDHAEMTVAGWTIDQLCTQFSGQLEEPVLDGTGLSGSYDFKLAWSEKNSAYPTFFTAVQEQLGLKLEAQKGAVQLFVVESAVKPALE